MEFKDVTTVKGTRKQLKVEIPTGLIFSTFISKEKYQKLMDDYGKPDALITREINMFIENTGKGDRCVMTLEFPDYGIKIRRYITPADFEKNAEYLGIEAKKTGGSYAAIASALWNITKTVGPAILNAAAPVVGQFIADKIAAKKDGTGLDEPFLQEGRGISQLGRGTGKNTSNYTNEELKGIIKYLDNNYANDDDESLYEGQGIKGRHRANAGITQLGTRGEGVNDILDGIAKFLNYDGSKALIGDFPKGPPLSAITNIANTLMKNNKPFSDVTKVLKDIGVLPKTGNGSKITNGSILKHVNKTKLKQVIRDVKREKRGGWIGPVVTGLLTLANLVGPIVVDEIGKLIK